MKLIIYTNSVIAKMKNRRVSIRKSKESEAYNRPNSCGYTDYKIDAGVYTKEEALKHAEGCRDILLIPIDIKEHNDMIIEKSQDLLSRYIK